MKQAEPAEVLTFWLGDDWPNRWPDAATCKRWFKASKADDAQMREHFGITILKAINGDLKEWEVEPASRLALILLLDQFTRNVYRGSDRAFSGDARAQSLVQSGLAEKMEQSLPLAGQMFFLMPLMHAEDLALQQQSVSRFEALHASAPAARKANLASSLRYAHDHLDVIQRFGRFPHRNAALERTSTDEELAFLETASRYGQ